MSELPARERIILAIDTSREEEAERLARVAKAAGARFVKLGLEIQSATSLDYCSELAAGLGLDWVADSKLDDIPNTVANTVKNIRGLEHPPFGITMHTTAGKEAMRVAQEEAGDIKMLGVTILTSITNEEAIEMYGIRTDLGETVPGKVLLLSQNAASVNLQGIVMSPQEVGLIKSHSDTRNLFAMIPGTRSPSAEVQDQARVGTPAAAIKDGADLLVIGRQITQAEDPAQAYETLVAEIEGAM